MYSNVRLTVYSFYKTVSNPRHIFHANGGCAPLPQSFPDMLCCISPFYLYPVCLIYSPRLYMSLFIPRHLLYSSLFRPIPPYSLFLRLPSLNLSLNQLLSFRTSSQLSPSLTHSPPSHSPSPLLPFSPSLCMCASSILLSLLPYSLFHFPVY